jgi:hypothetical protein
MFTELLPMKLGMGKSCAVLSGFCFVQSIIAGIKLVAKSFLQAAKAALTACWTNSFLVVSASSAPRSGFGVLKTNRLRN